MRLVFLVEAPDSTPKDAALWISGDQAALGNWNGSGLKLEAIGDGRHRGAITLAKDAAIEFKVTRGSWDTVEKDATGGEIANRTFRAEKDDTVRVRVAAWRDQTEKPGPYKPTLTGDIRRHPEFPSKFVKSRDVLVYLPPGYANSTRRYPAIYFHDGQNVFDAATSFIGAEWGVDETAERLIRSGAVMPFIAVAVANTPDRMAEYTPARDSTHGGGRAANYARFLTEELMPFVDRTYRTRRGPESTGVVGSSLGAIVSLYLGLEHPDRFGLVGCLSPAAWWGEGDIVRRARSAKPGLRIWVDIGTAEGTPSAGHSRWLEDAQALRDALIGSGMVLDRDLHYEEVEGAVHNERAWAARIDRVLVFLLGAPSTTQPKRGGRGSQR